MTNLLLPEVDAQYATKYPTLTSQERGQVAMHDADIAELSEQIEALQQRLTALREKRRSVFAQAALRDVTPEQVALTYRTTGQGYSDVAAIVRGLHPYLFSIAHFGVVGHPQVLAAHLGLTGSHNAATEAEPVAAALVEFARLFAPEGGLAFDVEKMQPYEVDWQWVEHASGMHPVDIIEDDCGEHRRLLLAHNTDGTEAVLLDRNRGWRYGDGPVAKGPLAEVLAETFRIVREDRPARDDEEGY